MNISHLHTNQKLIVEALLARGALIRPLDSFEELLEVTYKDKKDFLLDRYSSKAPYHVVKMSADKHFAKKIMNEKGINTPQGNVFTVHSRLKALEYAYTLYPVVLKPNWGSHGDGVQVNIIDEKQLINAINIFTSERHEDEAFIIEKYHSWREYRLFITSCGGFAVVHRQPASIIGNGIDTISQLIEKENLFRVSYKSHCRTSICPIVIDNEVYSFLQQQNLHMNSIIKKDTQVFLREQSNLAKGGKAIDMTESVAPWIKNLAQSCLSCFPGLPVAGLDLLCEDITSAMSDYVIIEINSNPGLAMHTYPSVGQSRNVAQLLLDAMFPDFFD